MPKLSLAHLKRTLTPGTRLRITNHRRPVASRDTRVNDDTNTIGLYTWALNASQEVVSTRTMWPKAADIRSGDVEGVFHIDQAGKPFLTVEVIGDNHPDAAAWPTTCRGLEASGA